MIHVLIVESPFPFSMAVRFPVAKVQIFLQFPWCKIRAGAPTKVTHNAGGILSPLCFFFPLEEPELRGDLSALCCTGLGKGNVVKM